MIEFIGRSDGVDEWKVCGNDWGFLLNEMGHYQMQYSCEEVVAVVDGREYKVTFSDD